MKSNDKPDSGPTIIAPFESIIEGLAYQPHPIIEGLVYHSEFTLVITDPWTDHFGAELLRAFPLATWCHGHWDDFVLLWGRFKVAPIIPVLGLVWQPGEETPRVSMHGNPFSSGMLHPSPAKELPCPEPFDLATFLMSDQNTWMKSVALCVVSGLDIERETLRRDMSGPDAAGDLGAEMIDWAVNFHAGIVVTVPSGGPLVERFRVAAYRVIDLKTSDDRLSATAVITNREGIQVDAMQFWISPCSRRIWATPHVNEAEVRDTFPRRPIRRPFSPIGPA